MILVKKVLIIFSKGLKTHQSAFIRVIENTRLALNREKFMLRGLERREREPWRALSVFEPSNINFSVFNANPSILFIPFGFFNVTFNINRSNNLNNNFNSVIKALKI